MITSYPSIAENNLIPRSILILGGKVMLFSKVVWRLFLIVMGFPSVGNGGYGLIKGQAPYGDLMELGSTFLHLSVKRGVPLQAGMVPLSPGASVDAKIMKILEIGFN